MIDVETPPVPVPSDSWLLARQEHLVREIGRRRRRRRRGGVALGGGGLVATGLTTALLTLSGPGSANAFAAWTASPTTPAPDQVQSATAACEAGVSAPPLDKRPPGLPSGGERVLLVDTRGPFTLVLFGADTSTTLLCVSGPSINSATQANPRGGASVQEIGDEAVLPDAGQIVIDRLRAGSADDGQTYTIAEGSVGSGVTAATLALRDGSDVVATTGNGHFLAWWPGRAVVTSATVTTATGTTTQPISFPTPVAGAPANNVERTIHSGP